MVDINLHFIDKETEIYRSWLFAPSLLITGRVRIRIKSSGCWSYLAQVLPSPNPCDFQEFPLKGRHNHWMKILGEEQDGATQVRIALGGWGMCDCLWPTQQPGSFGKGLQWRQGLGLAPIPVPLHSQRGGRLQGCRKMWKLKKAMLSRRVVEPQLWKKRPEFKGEKELLKQKVARKSSLKVRGPGEKW